MLRLIAILIFSIFVLTNLHSQVKMQETTITIPTYMVGQPETAPLFYKPEGYNGAQLRVYPYPYIGKLSNNMLDKIYKAIILENEFIKIFVLPELGGRIYYAQDKTNGYDFVYRNNVIKPAHLGIPGARISGGVEWNVPQPRTSTFSPVDYKIDERDDGSKTVWVGEYEKHNETRWLVGLSLYPGKSYVEVTMKYLNVTPVVNSFLFWANAAVHANENYQMIFPPDVESATFNSQNVIQTVNQTKGADISWWKNTTTPTPYLAWGTEKDFMAGIDHGKNAGTAIVADHYLFPGKKFGNLGNNDVQKMRDKMLTDNDGPYLEIGTGFYSDNQPNYSWINPYGAKTGTMYYYPIKNMNSVKEANKDVAVNLEINNGKALVQVMSTSRLNNYRILLAYKGKALYTDVINPDPVTPFSTELKAERGAIPTDFTLNIYTPENQLVLQYTPPANKILPEPPKNRALENPSHVSSADELFLKGLWIEQCGNALYNPEFYYNEAIKRDSLNILANTQLGIRYLKPGLYSKSEKYLRGVVYRFTENYTSAKYGEPLYYLGVNLFYQGKLKEAYDMLYKASWNQGWASQSYYLLAVMDCLNGNYNAAMDKLAVSYTANGNNVEALALMAIILRRNGEGDMAKQTLLEVNHIDPLNLTSAYEQYQMDKKELKMKAADKLRETFRDETDNYLETASRYIMAGFYSDAAELLHLAAVPQLPQTSKNPLIYYYQGYCLSMNNEKADAATAYSQASAMTTERCFPYGNTSFAVLNDALKINNEDATALYLLGNLLCDNAPDQAYAYWQKSSDIKNSPMVNRNLAFVLANIYDKPTEAIAKLDKALEMGSNNPMFLVERDEYAAYAGFSPPERLAFINKFKDVSQSSDKTELRRAELLTFLGKYDDAIEILKNRHFYVAESTNQNPHLVWLNAYLARGIQYLQNNEPDKAISDFNEIFKYPKNLEIVRSSRISLANYWLGKAYHQKGDTKKAKEYFTISANNKETFSEWGATGSALTMFYQAMAFQELGNKAKTDELLQKMIIQGNDVINKKYHEAADTRSTEIRRSRKQARAEGYLYLGFANKGMGKDTEAQENFKKALEIEPDLFDVRFGAY